MSEEFDPYLKWLGIPPKHQPAHHYRLLGLEAFESDPDAIENAADRQMAHLRTFRNGKRVELAERLLNEIAEAKVCLLNADKKTDYDAKLKAVEAKRKAAEAKKNGSAQNGNGRTVKAAAARPPAPSAKPAVATAAPVATPVAVAEAPASPMRVSAAPSVARRRKQSPVIAIAVLGVLGLAVLAVGAVVLPSLLKLPEEVAVNNTGEGTGVAPGTSGSAVASVSNTGSSGSENGVGSTAAGEATDPPPKNTGAAGSDADEQPADSRPTRPRRDPRNPRRPTPENPPRENPGSGSTTANDDGGEAPNVDDEDGEQENGSLNNPRPLPGTGDDDDDGENTAPPLTQIAQRKTAPAADAQKEIESRVRNLYKFTSATTPEQQGELAQKLMADAAETRDNPNDQFVMLRVAAETAAAGADVATAMRAVDALAAGFDFDAAALRLKLVEQAAKSSAPPADRAQAMRDALPALDGALAENKFAEVDTLVTVLLASARRLNDRELNTLLIDRRKNALAMKKQYEKAVAALDTLKADAENPAANGVVGSFWAFVKDNWEKGLPYLAKSDDAPAAAAAKRELAQADEQAEPTKPEDVVKLADAWFALAQKQEPLAKYNVLRHAAKLYEQAQPDVTGLTKTSVEQQLAAIQKLLAAAGPSAGAQPVSRLAHITMSCDSSFELYINGEYLARGDREEIATFDRELKPGDVLLAMAGGSGRDRGFRNFRRARGFAAVIKFEADGSTIVTGQPNAWVAYTPASEETWFDPRQVTSLAPPRLGDGDRHQRIEEQTGIRNQSIWAGTQSRAFFVLRIP